MQPSLLQTLTLNVQNSPVRLVGAGAVPLRVVVRSNLGVLVRLAFTTGDLSPQPSSETLSLVVGAEVVLVLAPRQVLYAAAAAAGTTEISVASNEAFPLI